MELIAAIIEKLRSYHHGLENYIAAHLRKSRYQNAISQPVLKPHHYGLSYLRACFGASGNEFACRQALQMLEPYLHGRYVSWEFLWHGALVAYHRFGVELPTWPLRFRNNNVANWQLLHLVVRVLHPSISLDVERSSREIACIARRFGWTADGFLCDERHTRSACYHCFSTSLLGEINEYQPHCCDELWQQAARWCRNLVLNDGRAILLGRGQHQLFGYAALVAVLARCAGHGDTRSTEALANVLDHLDRFRRKDGSMPLVLRRGAEGPPEEFEPRQLGQAAYAGWYAYNTPWDYLPLAAWQFREAIHHLSKASSYIPSPIRKAVPHSNRAVGPNMSSNRAPSAAIRTEMCDGPGFRLSHGKQGTILVAAPTRGYWADGQPFPWSSEFELPLVGADQLAGPFSVADLPLPGGVLERVPIREKLGWLQRKIAARLCQRRNFEVPPESYFAFWDKLSFRLTGDTLVGVSPRVRFLRSWKLGPQEIVVMDTIEWLGRLRFASFRPLQWACYRIEASGSNHWRVRDHEGRRGTLEIQGACGSWSSKEILTPQGPAQLLSEHLSPFHVHAGERFTRRIILCWAGPCLPVLAACDESVTPHSAAILDCSPTFRIQKARAT